MDEQEIRKIYTDELKQYKPLTVEEETKLFASGTNEDKEKLFLHTTGLVIHIAKDYCNCGLPFLDLVSEGMMGLKKAIDEFVVGKSDRLSTYAVFWIRVFITNLITKFKTILSLPPHMGSEIVKIHNLMNEKGVNVEDVNTQIDIPISKNRVRYVLNASCPTISLNVDRNGNDDKEVLLQDRLTISSKQQPNELNSVNAEIDEILFILDKYFSIRENIIFRLNYGIKCSKQSNLEIAHEFGFSPQRCNKIIQDTKKKLKRYKFFIFDISDESNN